MIFLKKVKGRLLTSNLGVNLVDLMAIKEHGTSNRIEIAVFIINHSFLFMFFMKLVETLELVFSNGKHKSMTNLGRTYNIFHEILGNLYQS